MNKPLIFVKNDQHKIADLFMNQDQSLQNASKVALVKIQSLKMAIVSPQLGTAYRIAVKGMIKNSFFQFIPTATIAMELAFNPSILN